MIILEAVWRAHPLEVIECGAIVVFCGIALAVCLIGLIGAGMEEIEDVDEFY